MKKRWVAKIIDEDFDLHLQGKTEHIKAQLDRAQEKYTQAGWRNIQVEVQWQHDYSYPDGRRILEAVVLVGERQETEEEYQTRIADDKLKKDKQEERERQEFERLKKKFGE